jgi:hypothetical protein
MLLKLIRWSMRVQEAVWDLKLQMNEKMWVFSSGNGNGNGNALFILNKWESIFRWCCCCCLRMLKWEKKVISDYTMKSSQKFSFSEVSIEKFFFRSWPQNFCFTLQHRYIRLSLRFVSTKYAFSCQNIFQTKIILLFFASKI